MIINMDEFSTSVHGLHLRVRRTKEGWEASIAGPLGIMDDDTAKAQAIEFASKVVGKAVGPVEWKKEGTA